MLLEFALARAKHESSTYKVPEELAPYVSKDPRYIKVYSLKQSADSLTNGGGQSKYYCRGKWMYIYLDNDQTNGFINGCDIFSKLVGIIPVIGKVFSKLLAIPKWQLSNANRGNGVIITVLNLETIWSITSQ